MSYAELTSKDKQVADAIRFEPAKTKTNMKKLNRIYNRVTGETYEYCMCTESERAVYYDFFYKWYDKEAN